MFHGPPRTIRAEGEEGLSGRDPSFLSSVHAANWTSLSRHPLSFFRILINELIFLSHRLQETRARAAAGPGLGTGGAETAAEAAEAAGTKVQQGMRAPLAGWSP